MRHDIPSLLRAIDLGRLVADYVQLRKLNRDDYVGLCPFHREKTPSFHVHPERGFAKCFGCGWGGDAIKFTMLYESMNFRDAVEFLAHRFNVTVAKQSGRDRQAWKQRFQAAQYAASDIQAKHEQHISTLAELAHKWFELYHLLRSEYWESPSPAARSEVETAWANYQFFHSAESTVRHATPANFIAATRRASCQKS